MVQGKGRKSVHGQDGWQHWINLIIAGRKLLRALQVLMCFRACHLKLMSLYAGKALLFSLRLHKAAMACCSYSILTALSSSGECIYIDCRYSLLWE